MTIIAVLFVLAAGLIYLGVLCMVGHILWTILTTDPQTLLGWAIVLVILGFLIFMVVGPIYVAQLLF